MMRLLHPMKKPKKNKRIRPLDFGTSATSTLPSLWDSPVTISSLYSSPSPQKTSIASPTTALRSLSESHCSQSESITSTLAESRLSKRVRNATEDR